MKHHSPEINRLKNKILKDVGNVLDRGLAQIEAALKEEKQKSDNLPITAEMRQRKIMDEFAEADAKGKFWRPRSKTGAAESA